MRAFASVFGVAEIDVLRSYPDCQNCGAGSMTMLLK